jgi:hypothetical protein
MAVGWRTHIVPGKLVHKRNKARPSYPTRPLLRRRADPALALRAWADVGGTGASSCERRRRQRRESRKEQGQSRCSCARTAATSSGRLIGGPRARRPRSEEKQGPTHLLVLGVLRAADVAPALPARHSKSVGRQHQPLTILSFQVFCKGRLRPKSCEKSGSPGGANMPRLNAPHDDLAAVALLLQRRPDLHAPLALSPGTDGQSTRAGPARKGDRPKRGQGRGEKRACRPARGRAHELDRGRRGPNERPEKREEPGKHAGG